MSDNRQADCPTGTPDLAIEDKNAKFEKDRADKLKMDRKAAKKMLEETLERNDADGLIMMVRRGGQWSSAWTDGMDPGSLAMASMKLSSDVEREIHGNFKAHEATVAERPAPMQERT